VSRVDPLLPQTMHLLDNSPQIDDVLTVRMDQSVEVKAELEILDDE